MDRCSRDNFFFLHRHMPAQEWVNSHELLRTKHPKNPKRKKKNVSIESVTINCCLDNLFLVVCPPAAIFFSVETVHELIAT